MFDQRTGRQDQETDQAFKPILDSFRHTNLLRHVYSLNLSSQMSYCEINIDAMLWVLPLRSSSAAESWTPVHFELLHIVFMFFNPIHVLNYPVKELREENVKVLSIINSQHTFDPTLNTSEAFVAECMRLTFKFGSCTHTTETWTMCTLTLGVESCCAAVLHRALKHFILRN